MTWIDETNKSFEEYKEPLHHQTKDGENVISQKHGKATKYMNDGRIFNLFYRNNEAVGQKEITNTPEKAFYRDGIALCALDDDWTMV